MVVLLKLSRPSYTQDLIYVDRAYTLDLFLITSKEKNFARKKFYWRKLLRFHEQKKTYLLNFSEILIFELSAQK